MNRRTGIPSRTLNQLRPTLDSLLATAGTLSVIGDLSGEDFATRDEQLVALLRREHPDVRVVNANALVEHLRMRHSAAELALERNAVDITLRASEEVIPP